MFSYIISVKHLTPLIKLISRNGTLNSNPKAENTRSARSTSKLYNPFNNLLISLSRASLFGT
jgi:hypothetical protein